MTFPAVRRVMPLVVCWLLAIGCGIASYLATSGKSATMDEPLHTLAAYTHAHLSDFRIDPEDPPLWQYVAMLGIPKAAIATDLDNVNFQAAHLLSGHGGMWVTQTVFQTRGNDGIGLIGRARARMAVVLSLLCGMTCWVAWRLSGPLAAVIAGLLLAFDPTFLAHGAIVKNDVAISLCFLLLVYFLWSASQRLSIASATGVAVACALGAVTKFSGVMFPVMAVIVLVARAMDWREWTCASRSLRSIGARLSAVAGVMALCGVATFVLIWLVYGFRFLPTTDPQIELNLPKVVDEVAKNKLVLAGAAEPTASQIAGWQPNIVVRVVRYANEHRLLPQAWLTGFLFTYGSSLVRDSYLLGQHSDRGWWYYFPVAMLVKTPVATIAAVVAAVVVLRTMSRGSKLLSSWPMIAMGVPCALYLLVAMTSNLNLGVRHMLPLYPVIFVGVAGMLSKWIESKSRVAVPVCAAMLVGLVIETAMSWPNYIAFFNLPAGGARGGFKLLGDSNLDWGQDLPLLADWQRRHPDVKLYVATFGSSDPAAYGIRYTNLPGGFYMGPEPQSVNEPGVVAVSATLLQGIYFGGNMFEEYTRLAKRPPMEVLGGTIYLYDFRNP